MGGSLIRRCPFCLAFFDQPPDSLSKNLNHFPIGPSKTPPIRELGSRSPLTQLLDLPGPRVKGESRSPKCPTANKTWHNNLEQNETPLAQARKGKAWLNGSNDTHDRLGFFSVWTAAASKEGAIRPAVAAGRENWPGQKNIKRQ
ncbi:coiled-coil domain-containing protein 60 [Anopheles sinensis]|uniref:Coiled-coil domain-containing protein 60 n=1 Tax=Anopheles sinensis TaxID=74873 RepID=A0A084VR49_ANOSI|nr:coiled-coil domain-containing protein 60 [Anopheles sinensis]